INSKSKIRKWKAGFILIDEINQAILMIKDRKSKLWGFPKGSYEEKRDETMFAFAQRELMEETGLSLNKDELYQSKLYKHKFKERLSYMYVNFISMKSYSLNIKDKREIEDARWISYKNLLALPMTKVCYDQLKKIFFI